jgi:hypothetical protein
MIAVDENLDVARLTEFLANDYARLRLYMGVSAFNAMGRHCLAAYSTEVPKARALSQHLPNFLDLTKPFSRSPELSDLARLEKAFHAALDAPEAPILSLSEFTRKNPQNFSLDLHPSVQRLQMHTNAASIWAALTAGELPPPPERLDSSQELLVWRQVLTPRFRMLGQEEAVTFDETARGELTGIDQISEHFLRGWLEAEVVSAVREMKDETEK